MKSASCAGFATLVPPTRGEASLGEAPAGSCRQGITSGCPVRGCVSTSTGLTDGSGVAFYAFPDIPKVKPFKDEYRAGLNSLQLTRDAQNRVLDEVKVAFRLNTAVFDSLGAFAE